MKRRNLLRAAAVLPPAVALTGELARCDSDGVPDIQRHPVMIIGAAGIGRMTLAGAVIMDSPPTAYGGPFNRTIVTQDVRWNRAVTSPAVVQTNGTGGFNGIVFDVERGAGVTGQILRAAYDGTASTDRGPVDLYTSTTEVPVKGGEIRLVVGAQIYSGQAEVDFVDTRGELHPNIGPETFAALGGILVSVEGGLPLSGNSGDPLTPYVLTMLTEQFDRDVIDPFTPGA